MDSVSAFGLWLMARSGVDSNLGHWAHQETKLYYNGLPHAEIMDVNVPARNGIDRESHHIG